MKRPRLRRLAPALVVLALTLALATPAWAGPPALRTGSSGPAVTTLNQRLASLSYLPAGSASSSFTSATYFAVRAFQQQSGLRPDGVVGPRTKAALAKASRPQPAFAGRGRRVEVSLAKQLIYLIRAGRVLRTIAVSSGRPGLSTPPGSYHVYSQYRLSYSKPYHSWMPYASYFFRGYALHGYPDYEVPSYPASHGCVRIPMDFALEVYHFVQVGDQVRVH